MKRMFFLTAFLLLSTTIATFAQSTIEERRAIALGQKSSTYELTNVQKLVDQGGEWHPMPIDTYPSLSMYRKKYERGTVVNMYVFTSGGPESTSDWRDNYLFKKREEKGEIYCNNPYVQYVVKEVYWRHGLKGEHGVLFLKNEGAEFKADIAMIRKSIRKQLGVDAKQNRDIDKNRGDIDKNRERIDNLEEKIEELEEQKWQLWLNANTVAISNIFGFGAGGRITSLSTGAFVGGDYSHRNNIAPIGGSQTNWTVYLGYRFRRTEKVQPSLLAQYCSAQEKDPGFYGRETFSGGGLGAELAIQFAKEGFFSRIALNISAVQNIGIHNLYPESNQGEININLENPEDANVQVLNEQSGVGSSKIALFSTIKVGINFRIF